MVADILDWMVDRVVRSLREDQWHKTDLVKKKGTECRSLYRIGLAGDREDVITLVEVNGEFMIGVILGANRISVVFRDSRYESHFSKLLDAFAAVYEDPEFEAPIAAYDVAEAG